MRIDEHTVNHADDCHLLAQDAFIVDAIELASNLDTADMPTAVSAAEARCIRRLSGRVWTADPPTAARLAG
jgi:hypothetical protein